MNRGVLSIFGTESAQWGSNLETKMAAKVSTNAFGTGGVPRFAAEVIVARMQVEFDGQRN
jgi:hypothetical protein